MAAAAATLSAQPAFRSSVDLVTVPIRVVANDPLQTVGDLVPADFRVVEDGVAQTVSIVSRDPRAVSVCILLDSSPSMASGRQNLAIRAVDTLLSTLAPDDEVSIVQFAAKLKPVLPWTRVADVKPQSWIEWRLALGTALIDAVKAGLAMVETAHNPQPVIVIVSDGGDNASGTTLATLAATRRQSETLVYGIDLLLPPSRGAPLVNRAFTNQLPDLVGDSGGTVYRVRSVEEGENAARLLVDDLRAQYLIGYAPKRPLDGKFRTIDVTIDRPGLTVRHRGGYLAVPR